MFKLELDMRLYFAPPMDEHGRGICVTKEFDLPFAPVNDMALTGKTFGDGAQNEGFVIKNVVWDVDRRLFLAHSSLTSVAFPIAMIPNEIADWIQRGWRFGSLAEAYELKYDDADDDTSDEPDPWEEAEEAQRAKPRKRSAEVNRVFRAIISEMAALFNNVETAYAMHKTMQFFSEDELRNDRTSATDKFRDAQSEFPHMAVDQRDKWFQKMERVRPSLEDLVKQCLPAPIEPEPAKTRSSRHSK